MNIEKRKLEKSLKCLPGTSIAVLLFTAIDRKKVKIMKNLISYDKSSINCIDGSSGLTPLGYCVANRLIELCTILLDWGADINARDEEGWTALHHAAYHGLESIVEIFIEHGAKINCRTKHNKYTPLHLAMLQKHLNVVFCLSSHKAHVKSKDSAGRSLLHIAIDSDLTEVEWAQLLTLNIDVNVKNNLGQTPLMSATELNKITAIRGLYKGVADINKKDLSGKTPLYMATEKEYYEIVEFLSKVGAISQSSSPENDTQALYPTALHLAIFKGYSEIWFNYLLMIKTEYEDFNCIQQTPLMLAVQLNNTKAAQALLRAGCKPIGSYGERIELRYMDIAAAYNDRYLTAAVVGLSHFEKNEDILTAVITSKKTKLFEYLIKNGEIVLDEHIERTVREENIYFLQTMLYEGNLKMTKEPMDIYSKVLMECLYTGINSTVRWIIKLDANVLNVNDDLGFSSLWVGVVSDSFLGIEFLLNTKCDPISINAIYAEKSLLQISIINTNLNMVELLLDKGAKPSKEMDELLSAVLSKELNIVKMLLDANAEVFDIHVNTARYMECDDIVQILIQKGVSPSENQSSTLDDTDNKRPKVHRKKMVKAKREMTNLNRELSRLQDNADNKLPKMQRKKLVNVKGEIKDVKRKWGYTEIEAGYILLMCKDNYSLKQFISKLEELGIQPQEFSIDKINDPNTMIKIDDEWYPRNFNITAIFLFANYAKVDGYQRKLKNMCEKEQFIRFTQDKVEMSTWIEDLEAMPSADLETETSLKEEAQRLMDEGKTLDGCIFGGWSLLQIAAYYEYRRVAHFLILSGAKVNIRNYKNEDSLSIARRRTDLEMEYILANSNELRYDSVGNYYKNIIETGSASHLKLFLQEFKKIDVALLCIKYHKNDVRKKEMLKVVDQYVNKVFPGKNIILYSYENVEDLEMLLKLEPTLVNSQDTITGEGVLHLAITSEYYKFINIFELMENFGVDLDLMCNLEKETALYKAIRTDRIEIAQLLIAAKADCGIGSVSLETSCLELAKRKNLHELEEFMINAGAIIYEQKVNSLFNFARISLRNLIHQKHFRKNIEALDFEEFVENSFSTMSVEFIQEKLLFEYFRNFAALKLIKMLVDRNFDIKLDSCTTVTDAIYILRDWIEGYKDKYYERVIEYSIQRLERLFENRRDKDIYQLHETEIKKEFRAMLTTALMRSDWNYLLHKIEPFEVERILNMDPSFAYKQHKITKESFVHILVENPNYVGYFEIMKFFKCNLNLMCKKYQETPLFKAIRINRIDVAESLIKAKADFSLGSKTLNMSSIKLAQDKKLDKLVALMNNTAAESMVKK